ncbi:MAG: hypothetical protein IPL53_22745 [Ignavibacteria bacterium]|nr:hypothetical protein [Ignavibacteria bacterium]
MTFPSSIEIKVLIDLHNSPDRPEYVLMIGHARGNNTWVSLFTYATRGKSDHPLYMCLDGSEIIPLPVYSCRKNIRAVTDRT